MRLAHPRRLLAAMAFVVVGLAHAPVQAQPPSAFGPRDGFMPSLEHLRPLDDLAREYLNQAWRESETVRALVEILEGSDVFVQIEVRSQETHRGILRFMSGSPECRWVRVTVRQFGKRPNLLAALAHELQHAIEIAEAPDARDLASVEALFRRIGFQRDEPTFETEAALVVEERVKRELVQRGPSAVG